jgi:hypothetical protein
MAGMAFGETPERVLKRVQQLEDVELPSLPSFSLAMDYDTASEADQTEDERSLEIASEGELVRPIVRTLSRQVLMTRIQQPRIRCVKHIYHRPHKPYQINPAQQPTRPFPHLTTRTLRHLLRMHPHQPSLQLLYIVLDPDQLADQPGQI